MTSGFPTIYNGKDFSKDNYYTYYDQEEAEKKYQPLYISEPIRINYIYVAMPCPRFETTNHQADIIYSDDGGFGYYGCPICNEIEWQKEQYDNDHKELQKIEDNTTEYYPKQEQIKKISSDKKHKKSSVKKDRMTTHTKVRKVSTNKEKEARRYRN